jgi:hypothetical protein
MDAYELPEEFAHLQAQDMSKIGFISDVVRGIKKVTGADEPKVATVKETVMPNGNVNIAPLLERAFMFIEEGDFGRADQISETVLNQDPKNANAYLCKLMVEFRVRSKAEFINKGDFGKSIHYQRILKFGDEQMKRDMEACLTEAKENTTCEPIYTNAIKTAENFKSDFFALDYRIRSIRSAVEQLESISYYKNAKVKADEYRTYLKELEQQQQKGGCYVATAVYGSYDCPQVWTLRRYRDFTLSKTWYGRAFVHTYYAISPTLVKWFGDTVWFKKLFKGTLDRMVEVLNGDGVENTPYEDHVW